MEDFMNQDFLITRIHTACFVSSGNSTPIHNNRPSHGLVFYTGGESCFDFGEKKLFSGKNDLIYLPKHSNYVVKATECVSGTGCYAINFDLFDSVSFDPFVIKTRNTSHFHTLFRQSEIAWRTKSSGYQMECRGNLYHILCALKKEYELGYITKSASDVLLPALQQIHENYTGDNLSIADLSRLCGMSETYFRRIFTKTQGVSPLKYINALKLARARELISAGMYSISQVSLLSGFHDEAYFSREFKKATGVCPSEYGK